MALCSNPWNTGGKAAQPGAKEGCRPELETDNSPMTMVNESETSASSDAASEDARAEMQRLIDIMARLRDPVDGCPWDVKQSFATIAPYTIEEAYEVADAIARDDMPELREELGDLLLQVVFHSRMAEEAGHFAFADVARAISDKMVERHPHVFGDARFASETEQKVDWETRKAAERQRKKAAGEAAGVLDGVATSLPALLRAEKLQKRAARVGFDWPQTTQVLDKIAEEVGELTAELDSADADANRRIEEEFGDLLFAMVNLGRHLKLDSEEALRKANHKFTRRFQAIEQAFREQGRELPDCSLDEMEEAWQSAKRSEGKAASST